MIGISELTGDMVASVIIEARCWSFRVGPIPWIAWSNDNRVPWAAECGRTKPVPRSLVVLSVVGNRTDQNLCICPQILGCPLQMPSFFRCLLAWQDRRCRWLSPTCPGFSQMRRSSARSGQFAFVYNSPRNVSAYLQTTKPVSCDHLLVHYYRLSLLRIDIMQLKRWWFNSLWTSDLNKDQWAM